jgi:hypothetical protein
VQRRARAGMALVDAYDAARAGDTSGARRTALQTLHGSLPVVVRGAAVMIWPRGAVRSRDRRYANREQG